MGSTLNDVLNRAVQTGFFKHKNLDRTPEFIRIVEYGSIHVSTKVYNSQGKFLRNGELYLDGKDERERYELVPESELPNALRLELQTPKSRVPAKPVVQSVTKPEPPRMGHSDDEGHYAENLDHPESH